MKVVFLINLLLFPVFSGAVEKICSPSIQFTNYVRNEQVFSSNNPKKKLEKFSNEHNVSPECIQQMLSALTSKFALEWINQSKVKGCFENPPNQDCPEETRKEIFGNITLFDQWDEWLSSAKTTNPDFSFCSELYTEDVVGRLTSSLSPILQVLKKEERLKIVTDLQKINCEESSNVDASDSPNIEYFRKLKEKGVNAPLDDFLKLWYPLKDGEREEDPYFFQCQASPDLSFTKRGPVDFSKIDKNQVTEKELLLDYGRARKDYENLKNSIPKRSSIQLGNLDKKLSEGEATIEENKKYSLEFDIPDNDPRRAEFNNAYVKMLSMRDEVRIFIANENKKNKRKFNDYLAEECKPDVLYSWGPEVKLKGMQNAMKDGDQWSKSPNPYPNKSSPLFMSMSPVSTFGYGPISVRIKIKKSIPFRITDSHVRYMKPEDNEVQQRKNNFQDFTTNDASVIENWSYGTPEHYDEIVRDIKRFKDKKRAQPYMSEKKGLEGLDKIFHPIDGFTFNEKVLKERLLAHIDMVLKGEGKIFYQKGTCRNREQSFRTRKPTYFNPH